MYAQTLVGGAALLWEYGRGGGRLEGVTGERGSVQPFVQGSAHVCPPVRPSLLGASCVCPCGQSHDDHVPGV